MAVTTVKKPSTTSLTKQATRAWARLEKQLEAARAAAEEFYEEHQMLEALHPGTYDVVIHQAAKFLGITPGTQRPGSSGGGIS